MPHHTLHHLTLAELSPSNEVETEKRSLFNVAIYGVLGDSIKIPKNVPLDNNATKAFDALWDLDPYEGDDEVLPFIPDADLKDAAGKPFEVCSVADALINTEVMLPNGNSMAIAKVVRPGVKDEGCLVGTFNNNPLLKLCFMTANLMMGQHELTLRIPLLPIFSWSRMLTVIQVLCFMKL